MQLVSSEVGVMRGGNKIIGERVCHVMVYFPSNVGRWRGLLAKYEVGEPPQGNVFIAFGTWEAVILSNEVRGTVQCDLMHSLVISQEGKKGFHTHCHGVLFFTSQDGPLGSWPTVPVSVSKHGKAGPPLFIWWRTITLTVGTYLFWCYRINVGFAEGAVDFLNVWSLFSHVCKV